MSAAAQRPSTLSPSVATTRGGVSVQSYHAKSARFWGVAAADFGIYDLFPDGTQLIVQVTAQLQMFVGASKTNWNMDPTKQYDVVFEVTGNPAAVRLMTDAVRVWGTVSVVAIHAEPMPVHLYPMFARELTMHGSRLYTRAAWEEAIRLAAQKLPVQRTLQLACRVPYAL